MSQQHAAYGGQYGGTYGGEFGLTYGSRRPAGYSLELTDRFGNERCVGPSRIESVSIDLNHSQLSGFDVRVPADRSFEEWLRTEANLFYGDNHLFRGVLLSAPTPLELDGETTLQGACRGHHLTRGHYEVALDPDREAWDAIQFVWNEFTPFAATVHAPPEEARVAVPDGSIEGSPMEIQKELHDHAGMRFTINHRSETPRAESYFQDTIEKPPTWTYLDGDVEPDAAGYANQVVVRGAKRTPEGTARYTGSATDQAAVDDDGPEPISIDDRSLTSDRACQDRAETELPGYVGAKRTSGTLSVVPALILPGYVYPVAEFARDGESPPRQALESVSVGESYGRDGGDATCELDFSGRRTITETVADLQKAQRQQGSRL